MATFTVKNTVLQVKSYSVLDNGFHIDIKKESRTIDDIQELLSGIYDAEIEDGDILYGFSTDVYKITELKPMSTFFCVTYKFMQQVDIVTAKQDYLAIMVDVDMGVAFDTIKSYYDNAFWTKQMVYNIVGKEYGITPEQYEEITGEPYGGKK